MGGDEKDTDQNAHEGTGFTPAWQAFRGETDIEQDKGGTAVLKDGGSARVGVGDGGEVGVLYSHHAEYGEEQEHWQITFAFDDADQGTALAARQTDENEQNAGTEKANGRQPFAIGTIGFEEMLTAGAGKAPADGGNDGEQNVFELHVCDAPLLGISTGC